MHDIIGTSTMIAGADETRQDDNCQVGGRAHLLGNYDKNNCQSNHNRWLWAGSPKLQDITTRPKTNTTTYSPPRTLQRHDNCWRRRRRRGILTTETYQMPQPAPSMTCKSILSAGCYLLLTLILILNTPTITTFLTGVSATSVGTGSNLAPERIHIIRQPASNPGGSGKQTTKHFKEFFEKFVIHVKENTPIGTKLADVQPRDQDTSGGNPLLLGHLGQQQHPFANEETLYKIMPNDDAHLFTIRKDEHKIELVNEVAFDYESAKKSYSVLIRATSIYFRYELEVDILVEDENDNRPQLDDFSIVFNNYKNHFPTGPIGRVPATDADVSDSLRFRVLSGNNAQLIIVNETNGDIQLSPELDSNVPLRAVMDIAVSDGINEAVAKLVLTVNLVTEAMLHNSVTLRLDGMTREDFLTHKYDLFLSELAKILGTSRAYSTADIVVFDVEESHHSLDYQRAPAAAAAAAASSASQPTPTGNVGAGDLSQAGGVGYRTAYNSVHITNASQTYVNVSFSARADGHDVEAYLSRQYIEERIYLHRLLLAQALEAHVAPFQDDACVQEPCQNYQECQVTYKFDRAPKMFVTERNMIFRQIKSTPSHTCLCPPTFTGMKNKLECNLQINQCYTNPCLNGGRCHRHESGYTCQCRGEFFGPRCEHSFLNSTCQSISMLATLGSGGKLLSSGSGRTSSSNLIQVDVTPTTDSASTGKLTLATSGAGTSMASTTATASLCSGKSRCQNLNKFHQQYYQKFASQSSLSSSSSSSPTSSSSPPGGFICQGCSYPSQWSNDLCQLRARSFERQTYVSLPSLRRRHRFHLALAFATVQNDALLMYNGRYNDRNDFIALEIVDSHLRFSYSLGGPAPQDVQRVSLPSVPVSDGEWHRVTIDYRDRNVTLMVDDCDPVLDEAIARYQLAAGGSMSRRCSNTTTSGGGGGDGVGFPLDSTGGAHNMLDLTSPMQLGALPVNLIAATSPMGTPMAPTTAPLDLLTAAVASGTNNDQQAPPPAWSYLDNAGANSFTGCMSDLLIDHQLVDLSTPLQDFGTQPGCSDKRSSCQPGTCQAGHPCQESFGAARCQCGEERLGRACELHLSQEKVRKFSGNSYLTFNPIEAQIPHTWQVSLHFRSINPNGILFKILLDSDTSIQLELHNGGLRLSHRARHLTFQKLALDDGEWHFVELAWVGELTASLQVDYNPNLRVQTSELGPVAGATMRSVIVGASSSRASATLSLADGSQAADSSSAAQQTPPAGQPAAPPPVAAAAPPESSAEFSSSTASPLANAAAAAPVANTNVLASDDAYAYLYSGSAMSANSSQSFVGCIYGLNISADNAEWWQSPNEERNVERGCPVVDPCESNSCPANSRCQRIGLNQRKCLCQPGFVGDLCVPVCELQPCRGENSRCIPAPATAAGAPDQPARGAGASAAGNQKQPAGGDVISVVQQQYTCECEPQLSGRNCEHQLSARCPANWWGRPVAAGGNSSICGPCNCDESRGFDGDCDKLTGQCFCKPNHYQPPDSDQCLACDCYLVGSLGTSCNQTSGQCKCRPGVVGRRCDTCASQFAEVTLRGCEVIYDGCPKTYSDGIWWDKTRMGELAVQQCPPSTSTGRATRLCHNPSGWQPANLFDCISNTFSDLLTQFKFLELEENKYQMSSQLAMKIASNLRQALNETISGAPTTQLYGSDMYISFRLIHHLVQHESQQRGMNLTHRQDRAYIRNLAESVSYLLDPAYANNWPEIAKQDNGGPEYLLKLLDTYGRVLIESQSDTFTQPFEVSTKHLTFGMDTLALEQLYDASKWSLGGDAPAPAIGSGATANHFPSSPPYATDPFDSASHTYGARPGPDGPAQSSGGSGGGGAYLWQADGTSAYLDFGATRDASPSVIIPKYDNYHASPAADISARDHLPETRALIPLKVLRMRAPKELTSPLGAVPVGWLGAAASARSRAKRQAFTIQDFSQTPMSARTSQVGGQQRPPVVVYSIYKTLGPLLPSNYDSSVQNRLGMLARANSPIVWLTVRPQNSSEFLSRGLQPKITYTLRMLEPLGKTRPQCAIWDFTSGPPVVAAASTASPASGANATTSSSAATGGGYGIKQTTGRFTTRGCELKGAYPGTRLRHRYDYVNCSCDHLGAVVVLMDSTGAAPSDGIYDYLGGASDGEPTSYRELALILALAFSLLILSATLFVLTCIRGHSIKSNSNSINKNLIVILALIESLILYSIVSRNTLNQREYQCKLIAIFLHYFTISLFNWLLVNAIHFYRMLTELRDINHGPMRFYHVLGYAVPAFFVALAVGLRMEQFGNYLFCWLSIHEPIIWSMFGPICIVSALIVLLFTLALCKSLPLDKMLGSDHDDPHAAELIKSHMLINVIKTPLIGLYSIMAVYAVNEALESAYLFPLVVVIKSLLLFALLCLVDKYIRYNMYVSWLRLKGEKVPGGSFVGGDDDPTIRQTGGGQLYYAGGHLGGGGAYNATMMGSAELAGYGGLKGPAAAAGQLLFPMAGGGHRGPMLAAAGFQSSCTDIFRPELLAGLSAASTTSRSSLSDDDDDDNDGLSLGSSSATSAYRGAGAGEYRRHSRGHHHHHHHRADADLVDEPDDAGYGHTGRRHRSRRHGGARKAHRKHSRHHSGHHHSHGHHHHHHRHRSHADQEAASYELESSTGDGSHHRHHHRAHRHIDEPAGESHYHHGRHRRHHHHHHRARHHDDQSGDRVGTNESGPRGGGSGTNSLDQILRDDDHGLLASSHSSDSQDESRRSPGQQPASTELVNQQQTVPMELAQMSANLGSGGDQSDKAKESGAGEE